MSAVIVVMLVAICEPSLIHCEAVEPHREIWDSVEACRADKARILDQVQEEQDPEKAVMGKCRLFLDEGHQFRRALLADMDASTQHLF